MNLIIYTCCQTEDCLFGSDGILSLESEWRIEWSDAAPQLGALVSMGAQERWRIVKITVYRSKTVQEIDSVHLAYIHPVGQPIPPESLWDMDPALDSMESIYAEIAALGKEELNVGSIESEHAPQVGDQTCTDFDPTSDDFVVFEQLKWWTIRRVVT